VSDFLQAMADSSASRAAAVTARFAAGAFDRPVHPLKLAGFDVIAELKNRSPAEGDLSQRNLDRGERARRYVTGGAAAISVLTEPDRFDGDLAHLREVVDAVAQSGTPVMRKDFLVEPVQILEARASGASGVLLIAAMLGDDKLCTMLDCAFEHGMFVLLEAFDEDDLLRSAKLLQRPAYADQAAARGLLIGVNTRNLRTLAVEPARLQALAPLLPAGVLAVAESGQLTAEDAAAARSAGYGLSLVGTALMRADDPAALLAAMLEAGRGA